MGLGLAPAAAGEVRAVASATDDAYAVDEDSTLVVDAGAGLLVNDTDDLGGSLCVVAIDDSALAGSIDVWGHDGSFTYVPDPDWSGGTSFTYGVRAGEGACPGEPEATGTVTITVNPVNDAPTARADTFQALPDRTLTIGARGVLSNDSDVDGDTLTAVKETNPAHGVVTLAPDGGFSYTPTAGYVGPDGFSYRASDGTTTSAVRVVSITVTALPTPVPTATPAPTPTPTPVPTPTPPPSPTPSPEPSASPDPFASASAGPSVGASASPAASLAPEEPAAGEGGIPIPVIGVGLLLLALLAFGGAVFLPKWLDRRRAADEPPFDEGDAL